ncbi:DUF3037 domain-containing protein [Rothia sp. CCM 9416]|uniref:DUF3037 domain-containing protein n=1 Tax=Rothia sp. CCM 9416 TaxID=3402655 RepID=UPI003AEDC876
MLYNYWVVRYVPDSLRPDTAGVGVIVVGKEQGDHAYRFVESVSEVPSLGGNPQFALQALDALESEIALLASNNALSLGTRKDLRQLLERERRQNFGVLRIDAPGQIVDESAFAAADTLYQRLIFRESSVRPHRVTELRKRAKSYYTSSAYARLKEHTLLMPTLAIHNAVERLDLAVATDEILELNSTFSFQGRADSNLENRVQAWTFSMSKLRKSGGHLSKGNRLLEVSPHVPIVVLADEPLTDKQRQVFNRVTADWVDYNIEIIKPDWLNAHAGQLEQQLAFASA